MNTNATSNKMSDIAADLDAANVAVERKNTIIRQLIDALEYERRYSTTATWMLVAETALMIVVLGVLYLKFT